MVRFHALGGVNLTVGNDSDARLILRRQKRLGLLAFLVLARPPAFHRRDELVGLFWPDLDEHHARSGLRQALHWLRKVLGRDAIRVRGEEEIAVDPSVVWCDAIEMQARLAADDPEGALTLYRGTLLPGLHLGGSAELERWLDEERELFARRAIAAATTLVRWREEAGDVEAAIIWARRAAELAPHDEAIARTLVSLLDRSGATAEAIEAHESFALRLRRHLDIEVSAESTDLVHAIRQRRAAARDRNVADGIEDRREVIQEDRSSATAPSLDPSSGITAGATARRRPRRRTLAVTFALLVLVAVTYSIGRRSSAAAHDTGSSRRIAVLPFATEGSVDVAWLREGLADLLSTRLDGAGDVRTVDANALLARMKLVGNREIDPGLGREIAERFDANLFVLGSLMEAGGRLRARATLYDERGSALGTVEAHAAEQRQLFALIDDLAQRLVTLSPLRPPERLARLGAVTTESFPALKAYLSGERLLRAGIFDSAEAAYEQAIAFDSTFALAWYRMAVARARNAAHTGSSDAHRRALAHASRLAPRDRLLLAAFDAFQSHRPAEAERLYREVLGSHPDEVEAWIFLGEVITYYGLWRGRAIAEARHAFERALALDSTNVAALDDLSWIASMEERFEEGALLTERMLALQPNGHHAASSRMRLALTRRDARAEQAAMAELRERHWNYVNWAQRDAHFSGNLEGRRRVARLLAEPSRSDTSRRLGHTVMARYLVDRGRWREALETLDSVRSVMPDAWYQTRARFHLVPLAPSTDTDLQAISQTLESWSPAAEEYRLARTYYLGVISARLGDSAGVASIVRQLDARAASSATGPDQRRHAALARDLALGVRAWERWTRGRPDQAIELLDKLEPERWWQRTRLGGFGVDAMQVWLRAEALTALGRDEEALRLFAPLGFMWGDPGMLAVKHLRMAQIYDRRGDSADAAVHYERFVEMWRGCDPALRGLVQEVERRVALLKRA